MDLFEPWRNAPPARYAVESDSEEDQDPEDYGHAEGSRTVSSSRSREPVVTVDFKREASDLDVIVAVEEAGRAWAEGLDNDKIQEAGSVTVDDRKVASISVQDNTAMLFFAGQLTYEGMHSVAEAVLDSVRPKSLTIIDSYSLPAYLSQSSHKPCIRMLASSDSSTGERLSLQPFEPPNLVQGIAASLTSQAIERYIPSLLLFFPTNLSDSTSASLISHSARRQQAPEQIYDFGGPSPHSGPISSADELRQVAEALDWVRLGWKAPESSGSSRAKSGRSAKGESPAGFGWWKEQRRLGEREIGEGAMYL